MKISKSEISLELDCWVDELSPAQLEAYDKAAKEHNAVKDKLKNLISSNEGKELFSGDFFSAYTFKGAVLQEYNDTVMPKRQPPPKPLDRGQRVSKKRAASNLIYIDSDDDEEDNIPLAKRVASISKQSKGKVEAKSPVPTPKSYGKTSSKAAPAPPRTPTTSNKNVKTSAKAPVSASPKSTPSSSKASQEKSKVASQNFRPSEVSSVGGLVIGADGKDTTKPSVTDNKEIKLQGKTFPSLVVLAKPWLKVKDMSSTRSKLDSKVKLVLMLTPNKFTEWLIQEGLLKSEQKCTNHRNNELKLGVYSDASKFPYSGGYVWISECCPTRFVSVFHGSLFEAAPHPPSCILKLIYHWSTQTNIQNVVQWVKVDNVYIKGVYTWLRAICTLAVHQKCKQLGGVGKYVEVGVISLGTTSQDGQQRQVKVEVLGVLDYAEKTIRLRAIEPVSDADRNYKKRFQTILEPLTRWVQKDSIIAIDLTVDKMTLYQLGFKNIVQAAANDTTAKHTNSAVMDYLRRIVPRMFQNTLSLLSRQMIQQFLDELVWRETFGTYALQAFNNITAHIAEQTRMNTPDTLTQRLYQVATNPFKDWSVVSLSASSSPSTSTTPKRLKKPINDADYTTGTVSATKIKQEKSLPKKETRKAPVETKQKSLKEVKETAVSIKKEPKHKPEDDMKGLEELYYGVRDGLDINFENLPTDFQIECPICSDAFDTNEKLQTHLVSHISIDGKDHQFQCLFCLEKHASESVLSKHNLLMHPTETKTASSASYHCIICQNRFNSLHFLTVHLQKNHNILELPYVCGACGYRSSSHRDVVRHFYDDHKSQNFLQCPYCLGIFKMCVKGESKLENVERFYMHLKQHLSKADNQKCNKCSLSFPQKGALKLHQLTDHQSNIKHSATTRQLLKNSVLIQIPRGKNGTKDALPYAIQMKLDKLMLCIEPGKFCAECDEEIADSEHYIGLMKCTKCLFKTCCQRAMFDHTAICQSGQTVQNAMEIPMENEMHCVCGFSSSDGNTIAQHLSVCQHSSAYATVEMAQENTVKRNMLDMLGLVRKEGDSGSSVGGGDVTDSFIEDDMTGQSVAEPLNETSDDIVINIEIPNMTIETEQQSVVDQEIISQDNYDINTPMPMETHDDDIIEQVEPDYAHHSVDMPLLGDIMSEAVGVLDDDVMREAEQAAEYSQHIHHQ